MLRIHDSDIMSRAIVAGDEAWVLQTAPVGPLREDVYPLISSVEAQKTVQKPSFNPSRSWGNLSPWFSVGDEFGLPDASQVVPAGCELTQVHLLHRHGARYPSVGEDSSGFAKALHKAATSPGGFKASGPLEFLNTWTYKLGIDILTTFGRQQLYDALH